MDRRAALQQLYSIMCISPSCIIILERSPTTKAAGRAPWGWGPLVLPTAALLPNLMHACLQAPELAGAGLMEPVGVDERQQGAGDTCAVANECCLAADVKAASVEPSVLCRQLMLA